MDKSSTPYMLSFDNYPVMLCVCIFLKVVDNAVNLYKYVFPSHLPHATLAIIGLVQPIGAFMPIAELQCRWFVNLLIGK